MPAIRCSLRRTAELFGDMFFADMPAFALALLTCVAWASLAPAGELNFSRGPFIMRTGRTHRRFRRGSATIAASTPIAAAFIAPTIAALITNSITAREHPSAVAGSGGATATGTDCCAARREDFPFDEFHVDQNWPRRTCHYPFAVSRSMTPMIACVDRVITCEMKLRSRPSWAPSKGRKMSKPIRRTKP